MRYADRHIEIDIGIENNKPILHVNPQKHIHTDHEEQFETRKE